MNNKICELSLRGLKNLAAIKKLEETQPAL